MSFVTVRMCDVFRHCQNVGMFLTYSKPYTVFGTIHSFWYLTPLQHRSLNILVRPVFAMGIFANIYSHSSSHTQPGVIPYVHSMPVTT